MKTVNCYGQINDRLEICCDPAMVCVTHGRLCSGMEEQDLADQFSFVFLGGSSACRQFAFDSLTFALLNGNATGFIR